MAENNLKETSGQITKGTVIYCQNDVVDSISVVVRGKVLIQNEKSRSVAGVGSFLGVYDLFRGSYQATYTAMEDSMIVNISIDSADDIGRIGERHPGYGGLLVAYFGRRIKQLYSIYQRLKCETITLGQNIIELYNSYSECCRTNNIEPEELGHIRQFCPTDALALSYMKDVDYYIDSTAIDPEVLKSYYNASRNIYMHHIDEQQLIIDNLMHDIEFVVDEYNTRVRTYVADHTSLYSIVARLAEELGRRGMDNSDWVTKLEFMREKVSAIEDLYRMYISDMPSIDKARLEKLYAGLSGEAGDGPDRESMEMLDDSYHTIMDYAEVDDKVREAFLGLLMEYDKLQDKVSVDKELIRIRDGINRYFYKIYGTIFGKAKTDSEQPLCVRLFLKYGFISEKFLSDNQLQDIIRLDEYTDSGNGDICHVYTLYDWLMLIGQGKKEPSKNEFDLDYEEYIREQLKHKAVTEAEAASMKKNTARKVQYEIENLFACVNRLLATKATMFVPVLHKDICADRLYQLKMTPYKINTAVKKVLEVDFSVFSREIMYTNPEAGITKDYIIKDVYPDVILFPCYGVRAVMWQDISGKKRDSEGRFVFPALFDGDEYAAVVGLLGRFRWELCKTIQGVKWNDIRIKSLTSEYQDYIQFYRKNSNLSEDWKEKINRQIKSARNNTREIFVKDYAEWVIREAFGNMRISKVSREILATYCPFVKPIRDNLERIPVYASVMKRYNISSAKKVKEYEARCMHIERLGKEVPQEIKDTRDHYSM